MKLKNIRKKALILVTVLSIGSIASLAGCSSKGVSAESTASASSSDAGSADTSGQITKKAVFSSFEAKDMEGNAVDQSLLQKNKLTVLNFWFNDCTACVNEMPELEKFNAKLKEKGSELVGINVADPDNKKEIEAAKKILKKQGVTYTNLSLTDGDKCLEYILSLSVFPTTVLVDKDGNIVGEPICGAIDDEKTMNQILETIEKYTK